MATSGTYVTEVPLKGSAEKHYKRWKAENHLFPDAVGHHIQGVTVHDGEWDSHGSIRAWNYTCGNDTFIFMQLNCPNIYMVLLIWTDLENEHMYVHLYIYEDGKQEVFKERRENDDENMTVTLRGLEGHVMEQLKVYDVSFQFIQKSPSDIVCKITMIWEKRTDDSPEPINYMKFVKSLVADMDHHVIKS